MQTNIRRAPMKFFSALRGAKALGVLSSVLFLLCLGGAKAQVDINAGRTLFQNNCSSSSCHSADPLRNVNGVQKGANKPSEIGNAIATNKGGMGQFKGAFSDADLANIAAYIATPGATTPPSTNAVFSANVTGVTAANTAVGTIGSYQIVTITNNTAAAVQIVGLASSSPDFVTLDSCPISLAAKASCNISVQFAPRTSGALTGTLSVTGSNGMPLVTVNLSGNASIRPAFDTPAGTVVEYYNPELEHYFITAGKAEQTFVDSGGAGRWLRTGVTFKSGGNSQVCRFYGNAATNTATGKIYGPNSHFYTADPGECAALKAQFNAKAKSWGFESNDFATTPATNGTCPSTLTPVYRAYNNGFAVGEDSNHRITTDKAAYDQLLTLGWLGESIVMCAPK